MILWNIIWKFKCKIYRFMVCPICFKNSRDALLSWSIYPYMIDLGIIYGCTFLKLKIHVIKFHEMLEFFDIIWILAEHVDVKITQHCCRTRGWYFTQKVSKVVQESCDWEWWRSIQSYYMNGFPRVCIEQCYNELCS
jgi:hypothetical protein